MLSIACTSKPQLPLSWPPTRPFSGGHTENPTGRQNLRSRTVHPDRVLHERLGLGRMLSQPTEFDDSVLVQFGASTQEVRRDSLRWLVPLTTLARAVQETGRATTWSVRKANEQGIIRADAIGQFAGHKVHYYDVSRFSAVVEQLSAPNDWIFGALVIHSRFGPGRILANTQPADQRGQAEPSRLIQFFGTASRRSVPVQELRRLLPSREMARRLQLNRKTFVTQAARRGIDPDYVEACGRVRNFYDESRLEEIRAQWFAPRPSDAAPFARVVLDTEGEIAAIDGKNALGEVCLRYLRFPMLAQTADMSGLRELVSLRELARSEQMSRYKLSRLLRAVGIEPVYQDARTFYFDWRKAQQALRARLQREKSAVTFGVLSGRTGISKAVLARKVRQGCIHTLDRQAMHCVDAEEAVRIEQIVRALRSRTESLEALSICRLHTRGRAGSEIARWDIVRMMEVARTLPSPRRRMLFAQVAWMCEGAGQKRLAQAFESYLSSLQNLAPKSDALVCAKLLLELIDQLPSEFSRYAIRLLLIASGRMNIYRLLDDRVRRFAAEAGCDDERAYDRFRFRAHHSLAELLSAEHDEHRVPLLGLANQPAGLCAHGEDECTPGAVIFAVRDLNPTVGIICRIEQQCWNAMSRRWEKTAIVRFADGEQRINPYTRNMGRHQSEDLPVLLRSSETSEIVRLRRRRDYELGHGDECIVKKAS